MTREHQQRLDAVLRAALGLPDGASLAGARQSAPASWDSLGHVTLMAALEAEFGLSLDMGDMIALNSYEAIVRFLEAKGW